MRIIGRKIIRLARVTSTNDLVRELAERGEAEGIVVAAEEQTAGRGRLGRRWTAPPGTSLQLSILLRPPLPAGSAATLTQFAALATAAALREFAGATGRSPHPGPTLKWPNDVLLNEKKCAGILVETSVQGDALAYAILGIGVNVNFSMRDLPELAPVATTLLEEFGHAVDRAALETALLEKLEAGYRRVRGGERARHAILAEWRAGLSTLGRAVRVSTPTGNEEGIAEDVDADGALLLRRGAQLFKFYAGDVTLIKDA